MVTQAVTQKTLELRQKEYKLLKIFYYSLYQKS